MIKTAIEQALAQTAVVIPSIQGRALLERLLPSIDVPPEQVVVVEQGSTDGSEEFCRGLGAQVLQLGRQATFTHACNAGIRWAQERGFRYVCLSNNDLRFVTPVVHQLLATCLDNAAVGAAAPTQVMITGGKIEWVAYRARWDLSGPRFSHDLSPLRHGPRDVDADFCEFTCVLVPAAVFEEVGLLDDDYGFYHEDADFGFRLWEQGYRTLYNQEAQVFHWGSSTVKSILGEQRKRELIHRNRNRFVAKHLRYGVNFLQEAKLDSPAHSWDVIVDQFSRTFRPAGLLRPDRPAFALGHPGQMDCQYLYVVWETTRLPETWLAPLRRYDHIFVSSNWTRGVFESAGFSNVHWLPLGVDPNVFHPAGRRLDLGGKLFLVNARPQHRKALDVTLAAWRAVRGQMPEAALALFCPGEPLADDWLGEPSLPRVAGGLYRRWYPQQRIWVLQPLAPLGYGEMAEIYRGAHCLVMNSRSEGFGLPVIEAMACGTLCIVPGYGATAEFIRPDNCLPIGGTPVAADYGDKGFGAVGSWWEPTVDDLQRQLLRAYHLPEGERAGMTDAARRMVTAEYSWRSVGRTLYGHLARLQGDSAAPPGRRPYRAVSWRAIERAGKRLVRGQVADGLVRAGQSLEKLGRVLRAQGVTSVLRKSARAIADRVGRRGAGRR